MSIKIYNGLKLKAKTNSELMQLIGDLRKVAREQIQSLVDDAYNQSGDKSRWLEEWGIRVKMYKENQNYEICSSSIVLFWDQQTSSWLCIPFTSTKMLEYIRNDPRFVDYCFYDNADWPEGMTKKEWTIREKAWDRVLLSKGGTPASEGFVVELNESYLPFPSNFLQ